MQKRSSKGYLVSITHKLKRIRTLDELMAYWANDEVAAMLADMDSADRIFATHALGRAWREFDAARPIPEQRDTKVRWTPERIERLRAAYRKHRSDDGIARELRIPLKAARVARWKYVGPIKPTKPTVAAAAGVQG